MFSPFKFSKEDLEGDLTANQLSESEIFRYGKLATSLRAGFRQKVADVQPNVIEDPIEEYKYDQSGSYELMRGYSRKKTK